MTVAAPSEERNAIRARRPRFAWDDTPLHWIPGDPGTAHLVNVLHLLLPAGEKWFVDVYREALPHITDEALRADVRGFMGQEAVHARAHAAFLEHLRAQGLETEPYTRRIDWLFERLLATERAPRFLRRAWLSRRLAIIAAIEHFTCVLGNWVLDARALDDAGADPVVLDLLRWHGAEEVEHRSVAFDTFQHLGGRARYANRVTAMLGVAPFMAWVWFMGVRYLVAHDPELRGYAYRYRLRDYVRAARQQRVPGWELARAVPRYLERSHHPSHEGSMPRALDYLASSAAVRAAAN